MKATTKRACRHCGCRHQSARTAKRCAASNPDWQRLRTRAGELASTGARHARTAYDWTAPRVQRGAAATWEGAKAVGRSARSGAKRVAPTVARGARAASERLDRWAAEPNGRRENRGAPRSRHPWMALVRGRGDEFDLGDGLHVEMYGNERDWYAGRDVWFTLRIPSWFFKGRGERDEQALRYVRRVFGEPRGGGLSSVASGTGGWYYVRWSPESPTTTRLARERR